MEFIFDNWFVHVSLKSELVVRRQQGCLTQKHIDLKKWEISDLNGTNLFFNHFLFQIQPIRIMLRLILKYLKFGYSSSIS